MYRDRTLEPEGHSPVCRHHWVIETPNGAVSQGRCKRCGVGREFRNSSEEAQWDREGFSLSGSRRRRGEAESNAIV
jgi:hypothetical protein